MLNRQRTVRFTWNVQLMAYEMDLNYVARISCVNYAHTVVKNDGTVVAWVVSKLGSDASTINLINVAFINSGGLTCAAVNNHITAAGSGSSRGDSDMSAVKLRPHHAKSAHFRGQNPKCGICPRRMHVIFVVAHSFVAHWDSNTTPTNKTGKIFWKLRHAQNPSVVPFYE